MLENYWHNYFGVSKTCFASIPAFELGEALIMIMEEMEYGHPNQTKTG